MLQLDNLQIFLAVARTGSLAGAAKKLDVNTTTIYRRLRRYEQDLGVRLFNRSENGHILTTAGEDMYATALHIEEKMHELMLRLEGNTSELAGRLNVTTTQVIAEYLVVPHLPDFRQQYPDIIVELHTSRQRMDLSKRQADLAIRSTLSPPDHLVGHLLLRDQWSLCVSKEYSNRYGKPGSLADFEDHHFILADEELGNFSTMQWLHDNVPTSSVVLTSNSLATVHHAVRTGLGLGLIPDYIHTQDDQLVVLNLQIPVISGEIWLLMHPDMRPNARTRAFADFIRKTFEHRQPHLRAVT